MFVILMALATAASPAPATCAALALDYDNVSKDLADNNANGIGDDSVYRSIDRKLDGVMAMERAHMALDLMRDHHCAMPATAPDELKYLLPAMTCKTDRVKASGTDVPPSCKRESWAPLGE